MFRVIEDEQRPVEKYLLTLPVLDLVLQSVLVEISLVPLESLEVLKVVLH